MTNPTMKRFRLRFSIRTLAIVVTLVCCYAACWGPTKRRGVNDVVEYVVRNFGFRSSGGNDAFFRRSFGARTSALLPCLVRLRLSHATEYYFWFFGYVAKLPWGRDVEVLQPPAPIYDQPTGRPGSSPAS